MKIRRIGGCLGILLSFVLFMTAQLNIAYADTSLPTKYDLREENRVTEVKDQGKINGCWAFAALSSLESNIKTRENKTVDFSENNMITHHGFDLKSTDGGNMYMATAYLASWKGPILEEKDTYPSYGNPINRGTMKADYHVQDVIFIPKRSDFKDNDKIKKAVMEYGAVYTNLKLYDAYYNRDKQSYRNSSKIKGYNHTVTIVGWDDDYPKENFKDNKDCGNGAFICKNSWGDQWGENGYFYVSYYDFNIGNTENGVFLSNDDKEYDNIYQYDELGQADEYGFSLDTAWFSNVFQCIGNEKLKAVSFYTTGEDSTYEIWISRDFNNIDSFKNKEKVKNGKIQHMGYHTISLEDIDLEPYEKFAVVVKLITKGSKNPIAIESPKGKYASKAKANKDESFISSDGERWTDLTKYEKDTNVCLKAFTKSEKIILKENDLKIEQIDKKDFSNGEEAFVKVKIKNEGSKAQKIALVVGLYDENNKMINHSYMNEEIKPTEEIKLSASVFIPRSGKYTVRGFVWDDSDHGICHMKDPIELNIQ